MQSSCLSERSGASAAGPIQLSAGVPFSCSTHAEEQAAKRGQYGEERYERPAFQKKARRAALSFLKL